MSLEHILDTILVIVILVPPDILHLLIQGSIPWVLRSDKEDQ